MNISPEDMSRIDARALEQIHANRLKHKNDLLAKYQPIGIRAVKAAVLMALKPKPRKAA